MTSRGLEPVQETEEAASAREDAERKDREAEDDAYWKEKARLDETYWTEQKAANEQKHAAKKASGQLLPGRIAALVILSLVTVLFIGVAIMDFTSQQHIGIICITNLGISCSVARTYGAWSLLLAGCAAFGAILVYWSRPRR